MAGSAGRGGGGNAGRGGDGNAGRGGDGNADRGGGGNADRRGDDSQAGAAAAPLLTVIRGDASAEEIAALTAVLAAMSARPDRPPAAGGERVCGWASRPAQPRWPLNHGPGAWRASGRPG